ncbi:hypothetical protein Tco_1169294 [Tanacetum coccineum]
MVSGDLEAAFEYPGGITYGIYGLFSGWYCSLASMKVTLRVSMAWAKGVTTGTLVRYETSCSRLPGNHLEDVELCSSSPSSGIQHGVAIATTGCKGYYKLEQVHWRVEERLTIKLVKGEEVLKIETTVTAKDGTITKFRGKFLEYKPTKGEEEILKLRSVWEKVNYDISNSDSDLESTARSGPRDIEMEDTGSSGI